jgi:hypothetical protein
MSGELAARVRRIYAAIDAVQEFDLAKVPATVISTPRFHGVMQDFRGGMSEEQISNAAHILIYNIANLRDHLSRWVKSNGKDAGKVDVTFAGSLELRILKDLSNNDRHGPPDRPGNSKLWPWLKDVNRVMRLAPRPVKGSVVVVTIGATGRTNVLGDGSASVVITGQVADQSGKIIGDLFEMELKAVQVWEALLAEYGLTVGS